VKFWYFRNEISATTTKTSKIPKVRYSLLNSSNLTNKTIKIGPNTLRYSRSVSKNSTTIPTKDCRCGALKVLSIKVAFGFYPSTTA
jgi:hypothetical protein